MVFAYYHTTDNTIAEQEIELQPVEARREALAFAEAFGFYVIGVWNAKWNDGKWEHEYARLERYGYFTAERSAELFDTHRIGRIV